MSKSRLIGLGSLQAALVDYAAVEPSLPRSLEVVGVIHNVPVVVARGGGTDTVTASSRAIPMFSLVQKATNAKYLLFRVDDLDVFIPLEAMWDGGRAMNG